MKARETAQQVRTRLIEVAGRTTQDLGLGRIAGQVLGEVYLSEEPRSLDDISRDLGLSKASVSIAARQLESLGLLLRKWRQGDRRNYYETARHFGVALRDGLLQMLRQKVQLAGTEIDAARALVGTTGNGHGDPSLRFIEKRLERAAKLRDRMNWLLNNPLVKMFGKQD